MWGKYDKKVKALILHGYVMELHKMVAVMMSGEEGANKQRQIKEVAFLAQQKGKGAQLKWLDPNYKSAKLSAASTVSRKPKVATEVDLTDSATKKESGDRIDLTNSCLEGNHPAVSFLWTKVCHG